MIDFASIMAFCGAVPVRQGGLLGGLFAAGAAGSVMHCAPMCGGFVLGQVSDRLARVPAVRLCEWQRLRTGLLLPYHLGRLTTYTLLGAAAGRLAGLAGGAPFFLIAAAVLFLLFALRRLAWLEHAPRAWGRALGWVTRGLPRGSVAGEYALGLALGFLPCGFLYAALTAAAAAGTLLLGGAAMLAFGLGTAPALVVVGYAGQAAGQRWGRAMRAAAPVVMGLNAMLLLAMAWRALA